jgi:hypothetical protein
MESQPKREEPPPLFLSRDQQNEIDACYELLASGRPISEVLEELRRIGKRGKVSSATLAIELAEVCSQFDETRNETGSCAPSAPIPEPSSDGAAASRSKFRRVIWESLAGCIAAGFVTLAVIMSVGQLPAAPPAPAPVAMAPHPEPIEPAPMISATEIAVLAARGEAFLASLDVVSARLFFARAALAGDPQAATRLAVTYDPDFIGRAHLPVRADAALAAYWYSYGGIKPKE